MKGVVRKGGCNKEGLERGRTGRRRVRWEEEQKRGARDGKEEGQEVGGRGRGGRKERTRGKGLEK